MNATTRRFAISACVCACFPAFAPRADAQKLFKSDTALNVTVTGMLGPLLKQRDSLDLVKHPAILSYPTEKGAQSIPVRLRARGHFRRQARNCDFPPLWVDVKSSDAKQTLLSGQSKIKLTTNCRPKDAEYEQYILQEFIVYKAYSALTDASYRTRLLHATYRDSAGKIAPATTWAFFVEDPDDVAARLGRKPMPAKGARFDDIDTGPLTLLSMFEYFIGNTDWSISGLHNITLLQDSTGSTIPVAYDFDWTGAVNARYAFPDKTLKIHTVTDRLYRGNCPTPEQLKITLDKFREKHAAIDAIFTQLPQLTPGRAKQMKSFFDDFWKRLDDPRGLQREIAGDCLKAGN